MQTPPASPLETAGEERTNTLVVIQLDSARLLDADARTGREFWFGSWLLSELSRVTVQALLDLGARTLIEPYAREPRSQLADGVWDRILAELPSQLDAAAVAHSAQSAMNEHLRQLATALFSRIEDGRDGRRYFDHDLAIAQVAGAVPFAWAAVPVGPEGYAVARQRCEDAMLARERPSAPSTPPGHRDDPSSSPDGEWAPVLDPQLFESETGEGASGRLWRRYRVRPGERLCGVGMLIRLGQELDDLGCAPVRADQCPPLHSPAHVAAAPLLTRLAARPTLRPLVDEYAGALARLSGRADLEAAPPLRIRPGRRHCHAKIDHPYHPGCRLQVPRAFGLQGERCPVACRGLDGCMLFESSLPAVLEAQSALDEHQRLPADGLHQARSALRDLLKALGITEVWPYYGVLLADGDRIGGLVDEAIASGGQSAHQQISEALAAFASEAIDVVERTGGSLIYASGDDVLALVPLHTALATARALVGSYSCYLEPATPPGAEVSTLSVGLGISHVARPMSEALDLARQAQRLAKRQRNALAVVAEGPTGGVHRASGRWNAPEPLDRRLNYWAEQLHRHGLPDARSPRTLQNLPARAPVRHPVPTDPCSAAGADSTPETGAMADTLHLARVFAEAYELAWGAQCACSSSPA